VNGCSYQVIRAGDTADLETGGASMYAWFLVLVTIPATLVLVRAALERRTRLLIASASAFVALVLVQSVAVPQPDHAPVLSAALTLIPEDLPHSYGRTIFGDLVVRLRRARSGLTSRKFRDENSSRRSGPSSSSAGRSTSSSRRCTISIGISGFSASS